MKYFFKILSKLALKLVLISEPLKFETPLTVLYIYNRFDTTLTRETAFKVVAALPPGV